MTRWVQLKPSEQGGHYKHPCLASLPHGERRHGDTEKHMRSISQWLVNSISTRLPGRFKVTSNGRHFAVSTMPGFSLLDALLSRQAVGQESECTSTDALQIQDSSWKEMRRDPQAPVNDTLMLSHATSRDLCEFTQRACSCSKGTALRCLPVKLYKTLRGEGSSDLSLETGDKHEVQNGIGVSRGVQRCSCSNHHASTRKPEQR